MKALLLGCGEMGQEALKDLYEFGGFDEILVGTRSGVRAGKIVAQLQGQPTQCKVIPIDVRDINSVVDLMKGCTVSINCTGPNYENEIPIAQAAITAKVPLVDINDEFEITLKMLDFNEKAREAGVLIILGLGGCPGIDNILVSAAAKQLDHVEEIHTAWVMSGADPGGLALSYHLLYSLSGKALTFNGSSFSEVRSFIDGKERIEFPQPIGAVDVYHIGHPEPITLSRTFPDATYVDNKATFVPSSVNDLIVQLGKLVRDAKENILVNGHSIKTMDFAASYLHHHCKKLTGVPMEAALRIEVRGSKNGKKRAVNFSSAGRLGRATGVPASIGAIMIAQKRIAMTGVFPPEACIEPNDFLYEIIDRRNIARLNGWIED